MELIKSIFTLLISFFQHKTAVVKAETTLADAKEEVVVETVRANTNAAVISQVVETQEALVEVQVEQKKVRAVREKKSVKDQVNDQFGSDE